MFYKLNLKEYLWLVFLIVLGYFWISIDQIFIPENLRAYIFLLLDVLLFLAFFYIVKPTKPIKLGAYLSCLIGLIVTMLAIIKHVVIIFDFTPKVLLVIFISFICPLVSGYIYKFLTQS
jgi:hypothetical protein